ncbi:MAG: hypothetical protein IKW74_01985, partial [Thermoguttaceae bacterium]|nr:hypothetical protein [Thermoguttaceae bacterium]
TNTTTPPVTMQSDTTSAQTTAPNNNWTASSPGTGNSTVTPENLLGNSNQMTTVSASNEIPITHTLDGQSTSSVPNASSLTETSAHFRTQVIAEQGTSQSVYQ